MRTRIMWKYSASRGVSGTPFHAVNGIILINTPESVEDWMKLLNDVYESQYP